MTEASNGREALSRIREAKPDLILLDLMMPEMDGFQVVADLQRSADWRDIPVIVITARDLDAKERERLNSGIRIRPGQGILSARRAHCPHPPSRCQ